MLNLKIDHLILGISDLTEGMEAFEKMSGLKVAYGGKHPFGTHNALCSLGNDVYLELIAPQNPDSPPDSIFSPGKGVGNLRCFGWAIRTDNIEELSRQLTQNRIAHSAIGKGSRIAPDGSILHWKTLFLVQEDKSILNPFYIEWEDMAMHPSRHTPGGCFLDGFAMDFSTGHPLGDVYFPEDECIARFPATAATHGFFRKLELNTPRGLVTFGTTSG